MSCARQMNRARLARCLELKDRAAACGSVVAHRICERLVMPLADAVDGERPLRQDDIVNWVKAFALPSTVIIGESAEVLHGKQPWCDVIEWSDDPHEGDEIWLPWLGCHVAPAMSRCAFCGTIDIDHGYCPCSACGFDGSAENAAALRKHINAIEIRHRAMQYARRGMLRDQARRQARKDKKTFQL